MAILGKPKGIFNLNNSDQSVGSYLKKSDICEILEISDQDASILKFKDYDGLEAIDERDVQKAWYKNEIPNVPPSKNASLDELILIAIIKKTIPECKIDRQIRVKRFKMDLKLSYNGKTVFVEFDGPSHFAVSRYGPPKYEPFRKKKIVEDETGIEVVNWAYWIQRCASNVKALFDNSINGYGALWSTNILFGDFYFDDSAEIIDKINKRFNATNNGVGHFYGPNTCGRNIPEHPIIKKVIQGKEDISRLLPKGFEDKEYWLPNILYNY